MTATESTDPLEELQREHQVIQPLLERLVEYGESLKAGKDVPAGRIAEAVRLWDQYLHRVHAKRIDDGLVPEARPVAMSTCFEHLDHISQEHAAARKKVEELGTALAAYGKGTPGARDSLAASLVQLASTDFDTMQYEERFPLSCLITTLPEEAAQRVRGEFDRTSADVADLERHIEGFLAEPVAAAERGVAVRCAAPACSTAGSAQLQPGPAGQIVMALPGPRWGVVEEKPTQSGSVIHQTLHFLCPEHAKPLA